MDAEAARVLTAAQEHVEADSDSSGWRELRDAAAAALAESLPQGAALPAFKTLSLDGILETMAHIDGETIQLPGVQVDTSPTSLDFAVGATMFAPWGAPTTWLNDEAFEDTSMFRIKNFSRRAGHRRLCKQEGRASQAAQQAPQGHRRRRLGRGRGRGRALRCERNPRFLASLVAQRAGHLPTLCVRGGGLRHDSP